MSSVKTNECETIRHQRQLFPGDFVRVALKQKIFDKAHKPGAWSRELFVINKVIYKHPYPLYYVSDLYNKRIDKKLYADQLQKVNINVATTDIVLSERIFNKKNKQFLVYRVANNNNNERMWVNSDELKSKQIFNSNND